MKTYLTFLGSLTRESWTKYRGRMGLSSWTRKRAVFFCKVSSVSLNDIFVSEFITSQDTLPSSYCMVPGRMANGELPGCKALFRLKKRKKGNACYSFRTIYRGFLTPVCRFGRPNSDTPRKKKEEKFYFSLYEWILFKQNPFRQWRFFANKKISLFRIVMSWKTEEIGKQQRSNWHG